MVEVEAERGGLAFAQREGGGAFCGVGEPEEFGEPEGAVVGLDVAQDAAGADRGELLVVADEPDAAAALQDVGDGVVEGDGVGHAGFVDDHQGLGSDALVPGGGVAEAGGDVPDEFGERVVVAVHLGSELGCCGGGRGESDDVAAGRGPGHRQGVHGGGLARSGRRDRELHAGPGGRHFAHEEDLAGVELDPVRCAFEKRQVDRGRVGDHPAVLAGGGDEALFGLQDASGGEQLGAGDVVDAVAVGAA